MGVSGLRQIGKEKKSWETIATLTCCLYPPNGVRSRLLNFLSVKKKQCRFLPSRTYQLGTSYRNPFFCPSILLFSCIFMLGILPSSYYEVSTKFLYTVKILKLKTYFYFSLAEYSILTDQSGLGFLYYDNVLT